MLLFVYFLRYMKNVFQEEVYCQFDLSVLSLLLSTWYSTLRYVQPSRDGSIHFLGVNFLIKHSQFHFA